MVAGFGLEQIECRFSKEGMSSSYYRYLPTQPLPGTHFFVCQSHCWPGSTYQSHSDQKYAEVYPCGHPAANTRSYVFSFSAVAFFFRSRFTLNGPVTPREPKKYPERHFRNNKPSFTTGIVARNTGRPL
jgi:hypothetical protein